MRIATLTWRTSTTRLARIRRWPPEWPSCVPNWSASPPTSSACKRLGVRIELDEPLKLVPGGAEPLQPNEPLAALSSRLSRTAICTGTIHDPRDIKFPSGTSRTGQLVVAKAALTAELPCQLLSYASKKPVFPRDSTSDQWFDHGQFDAYEALGRYLGDRAVDAAKQPIRARRAQPRNGQPRSLTITWSRP
jgi:hypothetical protein